MSASTSLPGRLATGAAGSGLGIAARTLARSAVARRRVRTAEDASTKTPYTVVIEVASGAHRRRHAADIRRVADRARSSIERTPYVVAVVAAHAGAAAAAGEIASSLAGEFATTVGQSLLVRTDTRRVSGRSAGRGFIDVLAHVDAEIGDVAALRDDGVRVVGAGNRALDPAGVLTPDAVSSFYEAAREQAQTVILEAAPVTEFPEARIICGLADTVVTVIDPRTATVGEVTETHSVLTDVGADVGPAVVMGAGWVAPTTPPLGQQQPESDPPLGGCGSDHDPAHLIADPRDDAAAGQEEPHEAGRNDGEESTR